MRLWPWTSQPKPTQIDQDYEQYNAYSQLLDRNGQWIGVADTKAGVILGFLVATFPILAAPALPVVQKIIRAIPSNANFWAYLPASGFITLFVLFLIAATITLIQVLATLTPKLERQRKPGLIFFGDIAGQEYQKWLQYMLKLNPQMLALQVLEQVYTTAYIANCKHKYVRRAICALMVTMFLGLTLYALSQLTN